MNEIETTEANQSVRVTLPAFTGPLDLLLHLIQREEIEITDIPIARITKEYLGTLELMRELDLEVAGEFLVMAATLMRIKARMLLPPAIVDEEEEDPRQGLIRQLLEYRRFKSAAKDLAERAVMIAPRQVDVLVRAAGVYERIGERARALATIRTPAKTV